MEEIKLPTVPELELIPIERRNFPEEDHKQEKIQHKRKERDSAARGLIAVTVASMMLNAVVLVKHDQITSWGSIGNHEDFDVYRTKERP